MQIVSFQPDLILILQDASLLDVGNTGRLQKRRQGNCIKSIDFPFRTARLEVAL
jgi:hypothetical protein